VVELFRAVVVLAALVVGAKVLAGQGPLGRVTQALLGLAVWVFHVVAVVGPVRRQ